MIDPPSPPVPLLPEFCESVEDLFFPFSAGCADCGVAFVNLDDSVCEAYNVGTVHPF